MRDATEYVAASARVSRAHVCVCVCKCSYVFKIRRMRGEGNEWGERARAGRARWSKRGPPGRNRMTERARGTIGGDDCQNRAARRYEKCSYLWHYFRRFELLFRPDPFSPIADAPRKSLSRAPFSSPALPRYLLTPALNFFSAFPYRLVPQNALRSYFLSSLAPSHLLPHPITPLHVGRGPTTAGGRAQRGDSTPTAAGSTLMLH